MRIRAARLDLPSTEAVISENTTNDTRSHSSVGTMAALKRPREAFQARRIVQDTRLNTIPRLCVNGKDATAFSAALTTWCVSSSTDPTIETNPVVEGPRSTSTQKESGRLLDVKAPKCLHHTTRLAPSHAYRFFELDRVLTSALLCALLHLVGVPRRLLYDMHRISKSLFSFHFGL